MWCLIFSNLQLSSHRIKRKRARYWHGHRRVNFHSYIPLTPLLASWARLRNEIDGLLPIDLQQSATCWLKCQTYLSRSAMVGRCSAKTLIAMFRCTMLTWFATAAGTCLPNGVIPELRKNLTNAQGESFPVGVILQPYSSAELAHEVLAILISEVLGYSLWTDPHVPASAIDLMFAMVGCKTWFNRDDRGCEERKIELHLAVESWHFSYPNSVESMRQTYQAEMPLSADMGYMGDTGQYISANAVEARAFQWSYCTMYWAIDIGSISLNFGPYAGLMYVVPLSDINHCHGHVLLQCPCFPWYFFLVEATCGSENRGTPKSIGSWSSWVHPIFRHPNL